MSRLQLPLDRTAGAPLFVQISDGLRAAIRDGRLAPGARLPSWRDLSAQLGVARGTVRVAYERLIDEALLVSAGAAGTRVARQVPVPPPVAPPDVPLPDTAVDAGFLGFPRPRGVFAMGVPAQDAFPAQVWSRILQQAARSAARAPLVYPDPQGEASLRQQVSAYLALARGVACAPSQVFITAGFSGALTLVLRALGLAGASAWMEEPGYPVTRELLVQHGLRPVPVDVDREGLDVARAIGRAPEAALAVVTPGQQAPLGVALSPQRRAQLLDWAASGDRWIVEDDYLGELQFRGRAVPALAADDRQGRVLHIGTFSKTLGPNLRLGFVVVPAALCARVERHVQAGATTPAPLMQDAVCTFLRDGHHLRHLRRMKGLYAARQTALARALEAQGATQLPAGLAVLLRLPQGVSDVEVAAAARAGGLAPTPLSHWFARPRAEHHGLLLGVTNVKEDEAAVHCERLQRLIARFG